MLICRYYEKQDRFFCLYWTSVSRTLRRWRQTSRYWEEVERRSIIGPYSYSRGAGFHFFPFRFLMTTGSNEHSVHWKKWRMTSWLYMQLDQNSLKRKVCNLYRWTRFQRRRKCERLLPYTAKKAYGLSTLQVEETLVYRRRPHLQNTSWDHLQNGKTIGKRYYECFYEK